MKVRQTEIINKRHIKFGREILKKKKFLHDVFFSVVFWTLSLFYKRDEKAIAIGSWMGERYADNSRYLMEYLDKNCNGYQLYWVGNLSVKDEVLFNNNDVAFLEKDKFSTNLRLLKCKYFFFSQMHFADISSCNVFRGAVMCYLHHGMPLKKWAMDGLNQNIKERNMFFSTYHCIVAANKKYDYFVVSSENHAKSICTALGYKGCTMDKVLRTGTPRNDMFFHYDDEMVKKIKESYYKKFNISLDKKIVMYLPTYRRIAENMFSFSTLSEDEKKKVSEVLNAHNAVLIEKSHCAEKIEFKYTDSEVLKFADKNTNIQEMMLFTDILISDYSGAFLDFILLDKPVIHYAYDYEYYKNVDSGLYYDISDFSAGKVTYEFEELVTELDRLLSGEDLFQEKRKQVIKDFMEYETGEASAKIAETVLEYSN